MKKDSRLQFLENFLCAGGSALLISLPHLYEELRLLSLVGLIPFLWRVGRVSFMESVLLGGLLASAYCVVILPVAASGGSGGILSPVLSLNAIFALYALTVNRIKSLIGFNVIYVAASWLPLEYVLSHHSSLGSVLAFGKADSALVVRAVSLFGLLMVSFAVILVNSLILVLLSHIVRASSSSSGFPRKKERNAAPFFRDVVLQRPRYFLPNRRAPPPYQATVVHNDSLVLARSGAP